MNQESDTPKSFSEDVFRTDITFDDLGLRNSVLKGVHEAGFVHPTHIQAELIPKILTGKDVLGQAKTGTGKTATFGLPLLNMCERDIPAQALVLAPTRELATQIMRELNELGKHTPIKAMEVIGGSSFKKQIDQIKQGTQIIVGTPGRVMDVQQKNILSFKNMKYVVLDEVDRMLDIGFRDEIRKILSQVKGDHQTIFVSATIAGEIETLARQYMKEDVEKVVTVAKALTAQMVTQKHIPVKPWDKRRLLLHLLRNEETALTIVFCRTKQTVRKVTSYLTDKNIDAHAIHGDLPQNKRNRIMDNMRKGKLEVLIASDLAARGLDVDGITHIINYDLPDETEVYVHRIGRTARAGRSGTAWSFVLPDEGQKLTEIEKLTGVMIEKLHYPDFEESAPPKAVQERMEQEQRKQDSIKSRFDTPMHATDEDKEPDPKLFPGGVVPKGPPKRNLGSRFGSRRRR